MANQNSVWLLSADICRIIWWYKPPMDEYLNDFIIEMKELIAGSVDMDGINYFISILAITCDAPARSLIKGIIQHTGYYSCGRCTKNGFRERCRIVFENVEDGVVLRTNDQFSFNHYLTPASEGKRHQILVLPL